MTRAPVTIYIDEDTFATWLRTCAGLDAQGLVATGAWRDPKSAARYAHPNVSEEAGRVVRLPARTAK